MIFEPLVGKFREDLIKIIETYNENSCIPESAFLTDSIKILRTKGYLSKFTPYIHGGWGVSYTYDDLSYPQLEKDYYEKINSVAAGMKIDGGINQINYASGSATINATQNIGINMKTLAELLEELKEHSKDLNPEERKTVDESVEVIQSELSAVKPKKSFINTAVAVLKTINGTAQFAAAVTMLIQFIQTVT